MNRKRKKRIVHEDSLRTMDKRCMEMVQHKLQARKDVLLEIKVPVETTMLSIHEEVSSREIEYTTHFEY